MGGGMAEASEIKTAQVGLAGSAGCVRPSITVLILTHNEALHIARAIASVRTFARSVVVIDSGSTDDTAAIAEAEGARVLHHPFVNYSLQFAWGLENAAITTDWTLRLDADEVIEPDLAAALVAQVPTLSPDVVGVTFARKHIVMGRWIRHGGRYPLILLRLWRTGRGRIEERWMDEHMVVLGGRTVHIDGGFSDCNLFDLSFFTNKHNKYATREMIDVVGRRHRLLPQDERLAGGASSRQARIKRWMKERFYARLPLGVGPLGYFLYRFFIQLGFLDGPQGLIYHWLQGFWYRFLVDAKIYEAEQAIAGCTSDAERLDVLSKLTGYDLRTAAGKP